MRLGIAASFLLLNAVGWVTATEIMADALGPAYSGEPILVVGGATVHAPWKWIFWTLELADVAPNEASTSRQIGYGSTALSLLLVLLATMRSRRTTAS